MKKIILIFLLFTYSYSLFAATSLPQYEPYKSNEFPTWLKKLRRAEVIAFGATALTYPVVGLATNGIYNDSKTEDFLKKLGISLAAGAVISLIDFIIGEVTESKKVSAKKQSGYKEIKIKDYESQDNI